MRNFSQVIFRAFAFVVLAGASQVTCAENSTAPTILTNAAQVRALAPAEAAKQMPVRLRGVVIENNGNGMFSMMDETAGIYAEATKAMVAWFCRW